MTEHDRSQPDMVMAVETVVAEYERHAAWLAELEAEVRAARARRIQHAGSAVRARPSKSTTIQTCR